MMGGILSASTLATVLEGCKSGASSEATALSFSAEQSSMLAEIAEIIFSKSKDFPNKSQLSIAVIQNGKTNYYGIIKVNDTIKPNENQNKIFEIGSITKVFTSTILASLVIDEKLKLTDEINTYYSFPFKNNIKISCIRLRTRCS